MQMDVQIIRTWKAWLSAQEPRKLWGKQLKEEKMLEMLVRVEAAFVFLLCPMARCCRQVKAVSMAAFQKWRTLHCQGSLFWHRQGDLRQDPLLPLPSTALHTAACFLLPFGCNILPGLMFHPSTEWGLKGAAVKRKSIFVKWAPIITSAAIFLCVKCLIKKSSKVQEFSWHFYWWSLLFSLESDGPQGITMSCKKTKVLQCNAILWLKCDYHFS